MMRSMFSGISGLNNHQTKLDVISDNIANVNTHGFKKSRVIFSNIFNQTIGYPSAPTEDMGGVNPKQVGLGVQTASIDRIFTQGATETTGNVSDCAIEGEGFFITNDGENTKYTRAGNFNIDAAGDFVHGGTGNRVHGWASEWNEERGEYELNTGGVIDSINFLDMEKLPARATTELEFSSNLRATAQDRGFPEENTLVYGTQPNEQQVNFNVQKRNELLYELRAFDDDGDPVDMDPASGDFNSRALLHLYPDGRIKGVEVDGNFDVDSIEANSSIFNFNMTPAKPPSVNRWTFNDINNEEQNFFTQMEHSESDGDIDVYKWRMYDGDGNLLDITGDGDINENDDFAAMSINSSTGKIVGFGLPGEEPGDPGYSGFGPGDISTFNVEGLEIELGISEDGRQFVFQDDATGQTNNIEIGSQSLNIRYGDTNKEVNFDYIPGTMHSTSLITYDSQGTPHELITTFEKIDENKWRYFNSLRMDDPVVKDYLEKFPEAVQGEEATEAEKKQIMKNIFQSPEEGYVGEGVLVFNELGRIDRDATRAENGVTYPDIAKSVEFQPASADGVKINLDLEAITQYDSDEFTTAARNQDGFEMGMLQDYTIQPDGKIVGSYSNDRMQDIGQLAMATFSNPMGLDREPGSMWTPTGNSGEPVIRKAGTGSAGSIESGKLEMSNVDLSQEFTDMIISQRGFQANSRSITTADQLLQELVNLKR
ncbi:MAG: flagellar hook protein FlgE [Candidatus Muiribacteriota bacterium]